MGFRILRGMFTRQTDAVEAITATNERAFGTDKRGLDVTELQSKPTEKEIRPILESILFEMRKMNIHLSLMTDEKINDSEVDYDSD